MSKIYDDIDMKNEHTHGYWKGFLLGSVIISVVVLSGYLFVIL